METSFEKQEIDRIETLSKEQLTKELKRLTRSFLRIEPQHYKMQRILRYVELAHPEIDLSDWFKISSFLSKNK